jgi:subtilisin
MGKTMPIRQLSLLGVIAALLALLNAAPASAQIGAGQSFAAPAFSACPDPATNPDEVSTPCLAILSFDSGISASDRASIARGSGAILRFNFNIVDAAAVFVPSERAYWSLASHPSVDRMLPDRPVQAFAPPSACEPWPTCKNDPVEDPPAPTGDMIPAGVYRIGADLVWGNYTGAGIGVAIVDTGLDSDHGDLINQIASGVTCLGDSESAVCVNDGGEDDNGHGTHVGGTVAAAQNGADVVGVAPEATLYSVKVLDSGGSGWDSNIIAGLEWIGNNWSGSVDVVNMSLGRSGNCLNAVTDPTGDMVRTAIQSLTNSGIAVVVSAGNDRNAEVKDKVPSGCPEVIAVASTTAEDGTNKCRQLPGDILMDTASYFTTDGTMAANGVGVTISAPGSTKEDNTCGTIQARGIESLAMGGGTTALYGTSMASPHVAGVVALMKQADAALCPEAVRDVLRSTADGIGSAPIDHPYISESLDGELEGVVDASAAVGAASAVNCGP